MSNSPFYSEFLSTNGTHPIITASWFPQGEIKAVVQIVHGMCEHIGRYDEFAKFLNKHGYVVCGHDHIGHGRTALGFGKFGYFGEKHGAKTLVSDSNKLSMYLAEIYPDVPRFLLGHSMGSFISRLQLLQTYDLFAGYICTGTGRLMAGTAYLRAYAGALSTIKGGTTTSIFINKSFDKIFHSCLEKNESGDAWISHDKSIVEKYKEDPLTRFYFANKAYADLLDMMMASNREEWYKRMSADIPIFLLSGKDDPIGEYGKAVPEIYEKLLRITKSKDVIYKIYENMRHEILNEINNQIVYDDILEWLEARIPKDSMEAN